jgi:hypothetical protein
MSEPDPSTVLSHQVLADPTGRRRRRLAVAGRVATAALGLWLAALILGGLGLQPLAGIPIVGSLGTDEAAPPGLPQRVKAAAAKRTAAAPAPRGVRPGVTAVPPGARRPRVTAPASKTRSRARNAPVTMPGRPKTTLSPGPISPARAPARPAPRSTTSAPGQTRTPPGQTKTTPGPPVSTPGATPTGHGRTPRGKPAP